MTRRAMIAALMLPAVLIATGPVNIAQTLATPKLVPQPIGQTDVWPGGSVEELWHARDELSLFVELGDRLVEFRFRGNEDAFETSVIIDGEERWVDYDELRRAAVFGTQARVMQTARESRTRNHALANNLLTVKWIQDQTGSATVELAEADSKHIVATVAKAMNLDVAGKGNCVSETRAALGGTAAWLACTSGVAISMGSSLIPCFIIGAGAYFLGINALENCTDGLAGSGNGGSCDCNPPSPDCMCCALEPGGVCDCHCPGEACCSWEDATGIL